eukprot:13412015-Alexandrium_andersonii.AAC.1
MGAPCEAGRPQAQADETRAARASHSASYAGSPVAARKCCRFPGVIGTPKYVLGDPPAAGQHGPRAPGG